MKLTFVTMLIVGMTASAVGCTGLGQRTSTDEVTSGHNNKQGPVQEPSPHSRLHSHR